MPRELSQTGTPWRQIVELVPPQWWREFTAFVKTGEARVEFIAFLEGDANCRRACDLVLDSDMLVAGFMGAWSLLTGRGRPAADAEEHVG